MKKWAFLFILSLVACATRQPIQGTAIDDMNVALHEGLHHNQKNIRTDASASNSRAMSQALLPEIKFRAAHRMNAFNRKFDIAVKDEPAHEFFTGLVLGTPVSMVVSPHVKGNITLSLKQVTVEQVLQALEDTYDYTYQRIPGGFEVLPNTLQTQIFAVNYLELQRSGNSDMKLHSGEVTEVVNSGAGGGGGGGAASGGGGGAPSGGSGSSSINLSGGSSSIGVTSIQGSIGRVETRSTINFWTQMKGNLENIIGATSSSTDASTENRNAGARSVTVNPIAGFIVVHAYTKELKQVQAYLDMIQHSIDRQVMLEAKILEVTLNDQYQMGIDWHAFGLKLNAVGNFPNTDISVADFPPAFTGMIKWSKNFTTYIQLLETQGNVQVLSSPRVSTMNNQKSLIKVGNDEFFVSGIAPGQAALGAVAQPTETISPFFTGITLDVTPQIDRHGDVTLHIHPSISLVTQQIKALIVGTNIPVPTPLAHSTIRESDTVVHAKNGQVVIIGGLMQNQTIEDIAQLPFFGNVPFLGTAFRATKQTSRKTELVILIKPTVLNRTTVNRQLMESVDQLASYRRGFHFGARPDIYGNEGEVPVPLGPKGGDFEQPRPKKCKNALCDE